MTVNRFAKPIFFILMLSVLQCIDTPTQITGTGSGWEGKTVALTGRINDYKGVPAQEVSLSLRSKYFVQDTDVNPGIHLETKTNKNGEYRFDSLPAGEYSLNALVGDSQGVFFDAQVTVSKDVNEIDTALLGQPGSVTGQAGFDALPNHENTLQIQVFGLPVRLEKNHGEEFNLTPLPPGKYRIKFSSIKPGYIPVEKEVSVPHGEQVVLPPVILQQYGCQDFACDSLVVRQILDETGLDTVLVDSVVNQYDLEVGYESDRVWQLNLQNIDSLPVVITQLTGLKELFIKFSSLTTLPDEIENLFYLRKLFVHRTNLMELPSTIGNMENLHDLFLTENELTTLPNELMKLSKLGIKPGLSRFNVNGNRLHSLSEDMESWMSLHMDEAVERNWKNTQKP